MRSDSILLSAHPARQCTLLATLQDARRFTGSASYICLARFEDSYAEGQRHSSLFLQTTEEVESIRDSHNLWQVRIEVMPPHVLSRKRSTNNSRSCSRELVAHRPCIHMHLASVDPQATQPQKGTTSMGASPGTSA